MVIKVSAVFFLGILSGQLLADNPRSGKFPTLSRHSRSEGSEQCSENQVVRLQSASSEATIKSPNYPDRYPSNQDCRWQVSAPTNELIVLRIKSLDLEKSTDCVLDYLQVYLGTSTLSTPLVNLCGTVRDEVIPTNSSSILFVFHSDPSYEDKGFDIELYLQSESGCPSLLKEESGTLSSPGFPANYPDSTDCWTLISVGDGKKVILQFSTLDLEFDDNCTYDFVEFYDGSSKDAPLLGRFCVPAHKAPVNSTHSELLVHFHSDHLLSKKGFQAQYTAIPSTKQVDLGDLGGCLWEEDGNYNGSIASPNFPQKYPNDASCNILITAPSNHIINLVFDVLQLETEANCSYDYIEITEIASHGFRLCGREDEEKNFSTSQNILRITFHSDDFLQFSGFKARYWFHQSHNGSSDYSSEAAEEIEDVLVTLNPEPEDIFLVKPENATLAVGSPYMLHCAVSDPVAKVRWLKDEQFLGGKTPLPGLKLVANNTLWIQSMNKNLIGTYTCAVATPEKTHYAKAWLKLENYVSPESASCDIAFFKKPRDSSFTEGEFAYMECLAVGSQLSVHWEKDGKRLETTKRITAARNGFLSIDNVTVKDAGIYTCVTNDMISGCIKRMQAVLTVNEKALLSEICGNPKAGYPSKNKPHIEHGKIIGGNNANKGAYPWQVMLWVPHEGVLCGGTLINERWIVTAAHCFKNVKNIRWDDIVIKLGKYNQKEEEAEEFRTVIAEPSAVIEHPAYNKNTFDNDIALVRLRDHVKFSDFVLPICLGSRQLLEDITSTKSLLMGTVTGWGKLKERGASPKYLQEIKLPVVDQKICISSTNFTVTRNMFCAGYSQEIIGDACHGDSGGPFIVSHENRWYLYGIVSWGEGCGKENKYGFYTKVANYLSWIKRIMKS